MLRASCAMLPPLRECPFVVAFVEEPAGSDVADPRVRCGKPATVELDDGRTLTYNDARRFGWMAVIEPGALGAATGSGVDALAPELTPEVLWVLARGRRTSVPRPGGRTF